MIEYNNITGSNELNKSLIAYNISKVENAEAVFIWISCIVEIPLVLLTLFALSFLIKSHRAASIYVTHLILSDLLQIIFICVLTTELASISLWSAYKYCLIVGLFFMACIAVERYVLVSHPHWYRSHHSVKMSCIISFFIWLLPLTFGNVHGDGMFTLFSQCLACFIPYSVILLAFIGTWRGLLHAISLTSHKRKLILGSLSLVLLNYTFLILPLSITSFSLMYLEDDSPLAIKVYVFCHCLLYLNPLADCLLYLFMRSDVEDILKSLSCCRSPQSNTGTFNSHTATASRSVC